MFSYYGSIYLSMKNKIKNCINKIILTFINQKIKFKENTYIWINIEKHDLRSSHMCNIML